MLDTYIRPIIDAPLNSCGARLAKAGITSHTMILSGFAFGVGTMILIAHQEYMLALLCFIANRLCDGLDGGIARHKGLTDFGGFLDIVCDFIIYAGIIFSFGIANEDHLMHATFLIFSFIGPITSFLTYAILAAKNQKPSYKREKKSFYYSGGICEGTETTTALIHACAFPNMFNEICLIYGFFCWVTTFGRIYAAWCDFGPPTYPVAGAGENFETKKTSRVKRTPL